MDTHFKPISALAISLCIAIFPLSASLWADSHGAEPPRFIMETFGCSYLKGKDGDDLNAARDAYVKAADKAGIRTPRSIVWHSFKGGPNVDFVWFNLHPNLAAFASHTQDMMRPEMQSAVERFNATAECRSNVSNAHVLFNGGQPPVTNPPGVVESYGCFFAHGRGPGDLPDLADHIASANASLPNTESFVVVGSNPMTPGPNTPDRFVFGVHEDMDTWASRTATLQSSEAGQRLLRHFNTVFGKCYAALWSTQVMVEGDEQ